MRLDSRSYQLAERGIGNLLVCPQLSIQPTTTHLILASIGNGASTAPSFKPNFPVSTNGSSSARMSLKEFLRSMASRGEGVEFHEDDPNLIRIPWIHASKKNWKGPQHCKIFIEWAKNTGKPTTDVKKCKANFRCALNSLRDVQEVPELSKKNGNDGYRVFRILTERPKSSKHMRGSKARKVTFQSSPKTNTSVFESPPVSPDESNGDCLDYSEALPDFNLFPSDYGIDDLMEFANTEEVENGDPSKIPLPVVNMEVDDDDDVDHKQKKSKSRSRRN